MPLKMNAVWSVISVIITLYLSSCSPAAVVPATAHVKKAAIAQPAEGAGVLPALKTTMGDFVVKSARLVDEVHGQKSPVGQKFLLVTLTKPDLKNLVPGEFSLETFQKMMQDSSGQIYVSGKDGFQFISTMAGWVGDEFAMGFTVSIMEPLTLHWPGNSPIELSLQRQ